jgi:hypothetical protein
VNYVVWMTDFFRPDYLITGIESNELLNNQPAEWQHYLELSRHVRSAVKEKYPKLPVAESITLHKLREAGNRDLDGYRKTIQGFIADHDFFGVSFYPFFLGLHSPTEFAEALAFLPRFTDRPIAITETGHPAEDIVVAKFGIKFPATPHEQADYLTALFTQAQTHHYLFVTYFASRDFDELWNTFPAEVKSLGQLWRDTGLVSEQDQRRPAYQVWKSRFEQPLSSR